MKVQHNNVPCINYTVENIKIETRLSFLNDLVEIIKAYGNKKIVKTHIDGNGSKYLYIYTTPPALIIRVSDHPTGDEDAINVKTKFSLIAETMKACLKLT